MPSRADTGRKPSEVSTDAGYCLEHNPAVLESRKIRAYMAIGRAKKPVSAEDKRRGPLVSAMSANLKYARHYRQCLLRDLDKVAKEWALICTADNLAKLVAHDPTIAKAHTPKPITNKSY